MMSNKKQLIPHFDNNGIFLGNLDIKQSLEVRCNVLKNKYIGYYLVYKNIKVYILPDGTLDKSVYIEGIYANVGTESNVSINHEGKLFATPSSLRYKQNVNTLPDEITKKIYDMNPVSFGGQYLQFF